MLAEHPIECARFVIGVDEAGRGPVVGDMVIASVALSEDQLSSLVDLGVRDSKELDSRTRLSLYSGVISKDVVVVVFYIPPWILDERNINDVEVTYIEKAFKILSAFLRRATICAVRLEVDEVKGRCNAIRSSAQAFLGFAKDVNVVVEPGADSRYPAVSAASIIAKVSRDRSLEALKKLVGDFGSGYASDSRTVEWIKSSYARYTEPPVFLRRSWSTLKNIAPRWYREKRRRKTATRTLLDYAKG